MSQPVARKRWQIVDGVLLLDKPGGLSSNDALQKARRLFSAAKAGHTGTLDPMATGLLPLCFGEATKFSNRLLDADKTYLATMLLGVSTSTGDAEGEIIRQAPVMAEPAAIHAVCAGFLGEIEQVPPMYSALKHQGKALYEYARQGVEIAREARRVTIYALEVKRISGAEVDILVRCSKGTYIRTLAEDIGNALGCGAHLTALRRTAIGPLTLEGAFTLDALNELPEDARGPLLAPVDSLLGNLPAVQLDAAQTASFLHGQAVPQMLETGEYRIYGETFVGLGRADGEGLLQPVRLIASRT
ncbi:MAG: tRNA pseudouridine(55) synthase TruB [Candidatus Dactylopiibacterium carminicum]|uniref:tRNA pseudouridine synthase B n=1 Tax=Candidatus Dactylopiibacterium carminicum TaxID=857335 RepID=A0A272EUY8_9RHOO|nr:tRNA pseudouridine(55) synthase TruB [Candidatus Dactylopiibacterium carminicum]KAF7599812.1 tRNA pseudouridine(55) synthase TruB [Candidatus Dactylopiibacterium carminicum]PAS93923.1 MAG: tRNA pseudouridine(55) synthase TruB [Candidatus Dactylopiibacterium carminicum]PAS97238.1 MAG: tRNA pseudouridine(55) synthase TruB [Candidatus Dactylopiibacterium carminicum]PAS99814.1 MAG: tRNA pseudouridine(55) synthase TruB [Candidatus Dactylopiibacterium carminicum]